MTDVLTLCRQLVATSFGGAEEYALLCGSLAQGAASPTSDIDVLVAVRDDVPLARAQEMRARFEQGYRQLHQDLGRTPDEQWPGEVMYARDAHRAVRGSALLFEDGQLTIAHESLPFRYWLSMQASGQPLSSPARSATVCLEACAELTRWRLWALADGRPWRSDVAELLDPTVWLRDWRLRVDLPRVREAMLRGIEKVRSEMRLERDFTVTRGDLEPWAAAHRAELTPPLLQVDRAVPVTSTGTAR